ncbi:MAG TPA: hypothetical protein VLS44_07015, partial [Nitrospira sp.]|nr:hypothetical protein [Nitrospira sp.]
MNDILTIQSPIAPANGKIIPFSLLNQHCAALAGGTISSFTVAGWDSLPAEPSGWLPTPLAFGFAGAGPGHVTEAAEGACLDDLASENN